MTMEKEMSLRVNNLGAWCLLIFAVPLLIGVAWIDEAAAQKVRVAMPAKSMTFLNFYVGDKFGIYKAEGLDVSLEVIKTDVGVSGMVTGELDYTSAIGSAMRAAATGVPLKAAMSKTFRVLIHHRPTTSLEAKFSLEYLLAAGLKLRTIDEECFSPEHVNDPEMRGLVEKVRSIDAPLEREIPGEGDVTVQVRTRAAVFEETVSYAPGHPKNPLTWERLAEKYRACARQGEIQEPTLSRSLEMLSRIEDIDDVRDLMRIFATQDLAREQVR